VGHCHLSAKGQNGLTCRHRKNDLALKLFEACARSFFILDPRKYRDFCLLKRAVTMEWRAYLEKPGRIKENAFWRINGSAPRQAGLKKHRYMKCNGVLPCYKIVKKH